MPQIKEFRVDGTYSLEKALQDTFESIRKDTEKYQWSESVLATDENIASIKPGNYIRVEEDDEVGHKYEESDYADLKNALAFQIRLEKNNYFLVDADMEVEYLGAFTFERTATYAAGRADPFKERSMVCYEVTKQAIQNMESYLNG